MANGRTHHPVGYVLLAVASVQLGAAIAKTQFGVAQPTTMVWLRMAFAGIFLALSRPSFRGLTRRDWVTGAALATCLALMNWSIYEAFSRIPLGLAVMIEFTGPMLVALASCRRWKDAGWVLLAVGSIVVLNRSPVVLDPLGIGFAVLAGMGWAGYIVIGGKLSPRWRGASVLLLTYAASSVILAAPVLSTDAGALARPSVLVSGCAVALLSSVVPYLLELTALKLLPARVFGVLQSLGPASAAIAGWLVLHETLDTAQSVAIFGIVLASAGAARSVRRGGGQANTPDIS